MDVAKKPYICVGLDFGTTYSGIAWAISTKKKVEGITEWDDDYTNHCSAAKVPTKLTRNAETGQIEWGYNIPPETQAKVLTWFKIKLSTTAEQTATAKYPEFERMSKEIDGNFDSAVEIVSAYLRVLWKHAESIIQQTMPKTVFEIMPIKFVLSTPAMWDHQAQEGTRQAAIKAGLLDGHERTLELVSEPEAAARFVLNDSFYLKADDTFVLCDAGGGTVDLISYRIVDVNPLQLEMCSEATGESCGAFSLDNAFTSIIRKECGQKAFDSLSPRSKRLIRSQWESGPKRSFKHRDPQNKRWIIDIVHQKSYKGPSRIEISQSQLAAIFRPTCDTIVSLVLDQVNTVTQKSGEPPRAILLVGGFGSNTYLKEELVSKFPTCEILQPTDGWSAIYRGAVLKGLDDNTVTNHISKFNYGVSASVPFQEHFPKKYKKWDGMEAVWKTSGLMQWYVTKGMNILKSKPIRYCFYQTFWTEQEYKSFEIEIKYADGQAPKWDEDAHELCRLKIAAVELIPWDALKRVVNKLDQPYRRLDYVLEMKISSGSLEWIFESNGKRIHNDSRVEVNWIPPRALL